DLFLAGVAEIVDAAVLEEAADDAHHADVVADALEAGPEAADAAHDQLDFDTGAGSFVEESNHALVDERVHLEDEVTGLALFLVVNLAPDELFHARAQVDGG